jgi:hypothetical protein
MMLMKNPSRVWLDRGKDPTICSSSVGRVLQRRLIVDVSWFEVLRGGGAAGYAAAAAVVFSGFGFCFFLGCGRGNREICGGGCLGFGVAATAT